VIKYLGSKRLLLPRIARALGDARGAPTVLDLFSGTSRVGHALKAAGHRVIACDHNAYAHALALCYVQADAGDVLADARRLVDEFNSLPARDGPGWFVETYCRRSRYFLPENGARIETVREAIARKGLAPELEGVMLTSLLEAADRVDSTTGVQMAYLKDWAPRARNRLELRVPAVLPRAPAGKGLAVLGDALGAAQCHGADAAYLDPPYNQHSYLGNYHVWETLVRWDRPETFGVACKRVDCLTRKSEFNSKRRHATALRDLIAAVRAPRVVVSLSDEAYVAPGKLFEMLGAHGTVEVEEIEYARYVGARIGIHSPAGEKVGTVGRLRNRELILTLTRGDGPGSARPPEAPGPEAVLRR